jgi:hypothetical protein
VEKRNDELCRLKSNPQADTSKAEGEINQSAYQFYALTEDENDIVERVK